MVLSAAFASFRKERADITPFQLYVRLPATFYRSIEEPRIEFPFISDLLNADQSYGT